MPAPVDEIRVNAAAKVRNADIRHFIHNGRPHIAVPSFTLPDEVVMNGGLYPADEIEKGYKSLKGTLAPVGHPTINGVAVLANRPEAINAHHVGVWNEKVTRENGRVYIEKWVDVEFAEKFEAGQKLLDAIEKGEPIHTSTGLIVNREAVAGQAGYGWIARNMRFDHDAILFGEPGAATPEDGVGLMVNSAELVVNAVCPELTTNGVLNDSANQRRDLLNAAIREVYGTSDSYAYVEDFNSSTVVYSTPKGYFGIDYEIEDGNVILGKVPQPLQARTEFVAKGAEVGTAFALVKNAVQSPPVPANKPKPEPEMDETKLAELIGNAVTTAVAPINEKLAKVESDLATARESLEVNAKAADQENRELILAKAPTLALAVNALSGKPLADLAAHYQTAAPITTGLQNNSGKEGKANSLDEYAGA